MFSNILGALQGPAVEATDEVNEAQGKGTKETEQKAEGGFSFWGVANALADSVKQTTADISASVGETDWRAEIEAFRKGVAEDATHVQHHAHAAAREGVSRIENLPQQAAKAKFPPVDPARIRSQFDQVGDTLGRLGTKVLASSKDVFEQVAEAVQHELDDLEGHINKPKAAPKSRVAGGDSGKFNRLEADISAMQRSSSTYCDQPQDTEAFESWLQSFNLESKKGDIDTVVRENAFMAELQSRIVPVIVQYDTFWTRYFYQLHKVTMKHKQMQQVVQRARSQAPAEELSWDDEDDAKKSVSASPRAQRQSPSRSGATDNTEPKEAATSGPVNPILHKVTVQSQEEEAETSTASDDSSGHAPWTVVSSPSHKRQASQEIESTPKSIGKDQESHRSPNQGSSQSKTDGNSAAQKVDSKDSKADASVPKSIEESTSLPESSADESDIEVSEDGEEKPGDGSEVEEDWGLWD